MASERTPTRPDPSPAFLELYKLAVEMADRTSARRGTANSFFVTVHAALVSLLGFSRPGSAGGGATFDVDYVGVAGLILAITWWLLLRSFRDLNRAKFEVIGNMEGQLPVEVFNDEWKSLKKAEPLPFWKRRYAELGTIERVIPWVFAAIYIVAIIQLR
jgi:hypothetical protein